MTFNANIPQGNQTISSTTSGIQTNFSQSNTAFGVDHVPFVTATNQGMHNKVSLIQQAADPTVGALIPAIYCKSTTSNTVNNDIYLRRASNDASSEVQLTTTKVNPSAASTGYSFLPGGIIIQWGATGVVSDNTPVSFGVAFPNACWGVTLTTIDPNATSKTINVKTGSVTTNQFAVRLSSGSLSAFFFAIGN